jgi:hypothetical protein
VSSREERPGGWDAGPASASGGHLSPDVASSGAIFDPLNAPLPSEIENDRVEREEAERTTVVPRASYPEPERVRTPAPPGTGPRPGPRRRPGARRIKRTIKHVDPMSVLKVSLVYYAVFLILWLIFAAIVYWILNSIGVFDSIEKIANGFAFDVKLNITLFYIEKWAFLIGLTFLVIAAIVNVFLAFLYNVASDLVGGIDVTFVERDI